MAPSDPLERPGVLMEPARALQVAAFYAFAPMEDLAELRGELLASAQAGQVFGTVLLADEGVNGTVCGPEAGVQDLLSLVRRSNGLRAHCGCRGGNRHLGMRRVLRRRIHSLSVEREREAGKGGKSEEGLVHEGRCVVEGLFSHVPQPKARSKGSPLLAAGRASPPYSLLKPPKPFNTSSY